MARTPESRGWRLGDARRFVEGGRWGGSRTLQGMKSTTVELQPDGRACLKYHRTCVVTWLTDGTFLLDTGGVVSDASRGMMPTMTTARRIKEFSPARVSSVDGWPVLTWSSRILPPSAIHRLIGWNARGTHSLPWVDSLALHVDNTGAPVLETLFQQMFSTTRWDHLGVQDWRRTIGDPTEPWWLVEDVLRRRYHSEVEDETYQSQPDNHLVLAVRRRWGTNRIVASVGERSGTGEKDPFVYVVSSGSGTGSSGLVWGRALTLAKAMAQVDKVLDSRDTRRKQPTLAELFPGGAEPRIDYQDHRSVPGSAWPKIVGAYGDRRVLRLHLSMPWTTRIDGERSSKRGWFRDSTPWPVASDEVLFWLELDGGVGIGFGPRDVKIRRV